MCDCTVSAPDDSELQTASWCFQKGDVCDMWPNSHCWERWERRPLLLKKDQYDLVTAKLVMGLLCQDHAIPWKQYHVVCYLDDLQSISITTQTSGTRLDLFSYYTNRVKHWTWLTRAWYRICESSTPASRLHSASAPVPLRYCTLILTLRVIYNPRHDAHEANLVQRGVMFSRPLLVGPNHACRCLLTPTFV